MGCKQQTSCIQQVPWVPETIKYILLKLSSVSNWPFNNGECDPQSTGLSKCASCCDNTKQAKTRACNLDTYMDKKLGNLHLSSIKSLSISWRSYRALECNERYTDAAISRKSTWLPEHINQKTVQTDFHHVKINQCNVTCRLTHSRTSKSIQLLRICSFTSTLFMDGS